MSFFEREGGLRGRDGLEKGEKREGNWGLEGEKKIC
jgi:hypothetical protein